LRRSEIENLNLSAVAPVYRCAHARLRGRTDRAGAVQK
jgi:hypothetical protein